MSFLNKNSRKRSVLVVIILLSVMFMVFQAIPYEHRTFSIPDVILRKETEPTTTTVKDPEPSATPALENQEKFLTYLPYSRFSNQRSTLLNAALLAKYLNRTLIVPPMFLGYANGWSPAPGLYEVLSNMTDSHFQDICFDENQNEIYYEPVILQEGEPPAFGCYNFTTYVITPWSWATDLNRLSLSEDEGGLGINIIERQDMSLSSLKKQLNLHDDDLYLMEDSTRYQWHIVDDTSHPPNPRYQQEVSIKELSGIRERLLHFYGIFGYDRLLLSSSDSEEYRLRIQQALIFRHPAITDASAFILGQLLDSIDKNEKELMPLDPHEARKKEKSTGHFDPPRFVAAHIRAGDGVFLKGLKDRIPEFVHQIWDIMKGNETTLDDLIGATNNKTAIKEHKLLHANQPLPKAPRRIRDRLGALSLSDRLEACGQLNQMLLYVATDAPSPRDNKDLQPLLDAFPCTYFMADFSDNWREPLLNLRSPLDPFKDLSEHLVMFVDATVCAWAERFIGTRTSTFSVSALLG
ncbi:uncharacterized protein BYT42DRAFT_306016 [Radiomyces spectabilis]|uniref:uncharacterized protein n=1 Tax=Radiomyces spectabilis TaxID=64574 RepID=UPI002220E881|nr:uncharacterized protein BYT42DRAFT_306016 [Radiomyces spectabilis]KAI8381457.1 hypothetical protein BYT42DRAFT_306016 [Radiomyces spectabilis]